jgi:hypothetical protein
MRSFEPVEKMIRLLPFCRRKPVGADGLSHTSKLFWGAHHRHVLDGSLTSVILPDSDIDFVLVTDGEIPPTCFQHCRPCTIKSLP